MYPSPIPLPMTNWAERSRPKYSRALCVRSTDPALLQSTLRGGKGKTTFLQMWTQHLRNEGCPVVDFNAWETDFSDNPLLALTDELIEELGSLQSSNVKLLEDVKTTAKVVLRRAAIEVVQGVAASFIGPGAGATIGQLLGFHCRRTIV